MLSKNEAALEGPNGAAVIVHGDGGGGGGGGAVVVSTAAAAAPPAVVIPLTRNNPITMKPQEYRPPPQNVPLSLPSGSPRLFGNFPDTDPGYAGIFHYLPHLRGNPSLLSPGLALSKGKTNVSIVIGIPTIRRPTNTYLYDTIQSLLDAMDEAEKADSLIFVCLTEPWNKTYVDEVVEQLRHRFLNTLSQGLLELVVPKAGFYPSLDNLPPTLGDNPTRVKWRTKQNLDYAYLMMHASTRGQYYLQLEDDIQATKGFVTSIKKAIATNRGEWFILEFSTLGFIGRLFQAQLVPNMAEFLLMFYKQKPCDWLMEDYLWVKMCGHGEKWAKCLYKIKSVSRPIRPSLFQHLGLRSSLQGKVNKLKDKHFKSTANNGSNLVASNPHVVNIYTSLATYANDIYDAYTGEKIFWATSPKDGDTIEFMYNPPVKLQKLQIITGDAKHPTDILTNAVVEVLPANPLARPQLELKNAGEAPAKHAIHQKAWLERANTLAEIRSWAKSADQCEAAFVQVGQFDSTGKADVSLRPEDGLGSVWSIRVRVLAASKTWLIVQKISITAQSEL
ncbi:hypothetical protein RRG08_013043 [Elysia crispata]|uniref:Uncharacterized protein n=1 Tax=Elysia crispata TaxID=231223 RepID=A0AAE1A0N0_9GAST|nr:hypothetical protein RRG08_013043 [Elysia crispata]